MRLVALGLGAALLGCPGPDEAPERRVERAEASPAGRSATAPRARPNVVFYLIDTARADRFGAYGSERATSPFLDRLADAGAVFERCIAPSTWTKPSMAAILTSLHSSTLGIDSLLQRLAPDVVTLAEAFAGAGYYSAGFSANPIMGSLSGYDRGFHFFREAVSVIPHGDPIGYASGSARALNAAISAWLEENAGAPYLTGEQPLFLYVHSVDPHEEYAPAPAFLARFADPAGEASYREQRSRLLNRAKKRQGTPDLHRTRRHFEAVGLEVEPFMDYSKRLYDADLRANDHELERLADRLGSIGLLENAILVVTSDHGEEFMEHGGTSHGFSLYDEVIHVPLVLWGPGIVPPDVRVAEPVSSLDVYPTLLELAGLPHSLPTEGRSLALRLVGEASSAPRTLFSEQHEGTDATDILKGRGDGVAAVRFPWKYVRYSRPPVERALPPRELFHLGDDPGERRNLADARPEVAQELDRAIDAWEARERRRAFSPAR